MMGGATAFVGALAGAGFVDLRGPRLVLSVCGVVMAWNADDGGPGRVLRNPFRRDLAAYVRDNPGAHLAAIAQAFGKSPELVGYHLALLESAGTIVSERQGRYRAYFPVRLDTAPRWVLSLLRDPTRRAILRALCASPGLTQKALADQLGITQSAVSYHLRALSNHGLLEAREGWPARYRARDVDPSLLQPGGDGPRDPPAQP